jgi:hypothetical protein
MVCASIITRRASARAQSMYGRRTAAGAFTREGATTPALSRVVVDNLLIVAEIFGLPIQVMWCRWEA